MQTQRRSLRGAINAFCRSCIYDPRAAGRWREQVAACTSPGCPLWPVRATTTAAADEAETADFEPEEAREEGEANYDPSEAEIEPETA